MTKDPRKKNPAHLKEGGEEKFLGDLKISVCPFEDLSNRFEEFQTQAFQQLNDRQKIERVNVVLCGLIQKEKTPCFLLPAVLNFFEKINDLKIFEPYAFYQFELWLNQFAELTPEENYAIRAKIAGKFIPRDEYQALFPIGMGKVYRGSHFVTAHSSPDLDTTVASFWGWLDAFAAQVSEGVHLWNVPGGAPVSLVEIGFLFYQMFGKGVFHLLAKTRTTLALSALDLMTQKGLVRKQPNESTLTIDHERMQSAVVLVDEQGYYLGDWRNFDVEGVRNVIMLLNNCLRWFENHLQAKLISLFAKEKLSI